MPVSIIIQLGVVLILTLFEGFFAGSEIALITVRKTRIANLAKQGNRRAKVIEELQSTPERLFATVQIGISVLTIFASAFAGTNFAEALAPQVGRIGIPFLVNHAYAVSFALVVAFVTYITVVLGELVPKSLAIRYSEGFALWAAYPIWWMSRLTRVPAKALNWSSNLLLKPFHDATSFSESKLSEEEIRTLLYEGKRDGTIEAREHEILQNVFEFTDLTAGKVMIPRSRIIAFDINEPAVNVIPKAIESGYTRIPFYEGTLNNVIGILHIKDLLPYLGKGFENLDIRKLLLPPLFVPDTQKINALLHQFQKRKLHEALVTNEHGEVEGLITLEDVLEELVGDISDEDDEAPKDKVKQPDESHLVKANISVIDFNKYFGAIVPENDQFTVMSGFILARLGRFARIGDVVEFDGWLFEIKHIDERTVKELIVKKK